MMVAAKFGKEMQGQRLKLYFSDGEICDGVVGSVPAHDDCEGCNGFDFKLLSTNRPEKYEAMNVKIGSDLWANFRDLGSYEVLEERN